MNTLLLCRDMEDERNDVTKLGHMNNFFHKLTKNVALGGSAAPQQPQQQTWQPRANVAVMNGDSSTWLLDSGASHHMTSDIANLSLHTPYNGGDEVMLGDGSGLNITHTGLLSLPSLAQPFFINNVLCVPALDKNLISVFQLCSTNGVAVTFT